MVLNAIPLPPGKRPPCPQSTLPHTLQPHLAVSWPPRQRKQTTVHLFEGPRVGLRRCNKTYCPGWQGRGDKAVAEREEGRRLWCISEILGPGPS